MDFEDRMERLERDAFISRTMVGLCPRCGSSNTHDCEAPSFYTGFDGKQIIKLGSECGVARELDDPTIGHCDDCDYLWCLECGSELSLDEHVCTHWKICEDCGKTNDYPSDCHFKEEVDSGNLLVEPCSLGCPMIEECSKCGYEMDRGECPKIKNHQAI